MAEWLADKGAGNIVLNGRRDPDPEAEQVIEAIRQRGIRVEVEIADMTDTEAIDRMLARMDANYPPLAGVIHSVGVLSDAALTNQSWESFEQVLSPKIVGPGTCIGRLWTGTLICSCCLPAASVSWEIRDRRTTQRPTHFWTNWLPIVVRWVCQDSLLPGEHGRRSAKLRNSASALSSGGQHLGADGLRHGKV